MSFRNYACVFTLPCLLGACSVSTEPFTQAKIDNFAAMQKVRLAEDAVPASGRVDLAQAIARAIKFNLDHKAEQMAASVALAKLNVASWQMLPGVVA